MGQTIRFENITGEPFTALYQAQAWCEARGYSMGSPQRGAPIGIKRGDCGISKWRDLNSYERRAMDGEVHGEGGSFRSGWVEIRLRRERPNRDQDR